MRVWRICGERYAAETLTGRGGLFTPGRWHTAGHPVVYASASLALAALEVLVHVDRDVVPTALVQVEIDVPGELPVVSIDAGFLPKGWRRYPAPPALRRLGDEWLAGRKAAVLQVPSAVIPSENNFLLNPQHPDLAGITVVTVARFAYDSRLAR